MLAFVYELLTRKKCAQTNHLFCSRACLARLNFGPELPGSIRLLRCVLLAWAALQPLTTTYANTVSLAWDPSDSQDVIGYNLYYGPASQTYTHKMTVGNTLVATVSGLTEGAAYFFCVTVYGSTGEESEPSNEISVSAQNSAIETGYVTGQKLGTVRNDFSGYVGMQVVVGAEPLTVTALGRMMASGNSGIHTVKFVRANDGAEVAGGAVTVVMSGGRSGNFSMGA